MKKIIITIFVSLISIVLVGCDNSNSIHVIATAIPHAEILYEAAPLIKEAGFSLKVTVVDDYSIPNQAVATASADANFFQHVPFFDSYNSKAKDSEKLVNVAGIHIEPLAGYSKKLTSINDLKIGSKILISNSVPDHGRILFILKEHGLIELKEGVTHLTATLDDVIGNDYTFVKVDASLLAIQYLNSNDIDLAFINGNYALGANLDSNQRIVVESGLNNPYVNIVAVLAGNENNEKIVALVNALKSDVIKEFINQKYGGSVIAV